MRLAQYGIRYTIKTEIKPNLYHTKIKFEVCSKNEVSVSRILGKVQSIIDTKRTKNVLYKITCSECDSSYIGQTY